MLAALRKLVRLFALLVVGVVLVHALEPYVPLCRCIGDAVRRTRTYQDLDARLGEADPLEAAAQAGEAVRRTLEAPPTLGELITPERRARARAAWTSARSHAADALDAAADAVEPSGAAAP